MKSSVLPAFGALAALGTPAAHAAEPSAATAPRPVVHASVAEARAQLAAHPRAVFLDVRQPDEFATGHAQGALLKPLPDLERWAPLLEPKATYVVICQSGRRSAAAAEQLSRLGFSDVTTVDGGTVAWKAAGLPMQP
jgi:rhodanese-related sulfurtransferase